MLVSKHIKSDHTDSILCCTLNHKHKLLISGGEDGLLCFTDLESLQPVGHLCPQQGEVVTSLACSPTNDVVFLSAGSIVAVLDLTKGFNDTAVRDTYQINQDEINSLAVNAAGTWLAAGDDSGEVQLVNLAASQSSLKLAYRTLRRGHANICSSVCFLPNRPSDLMSGGLDCCIARWDYARIRLVQHYNLNTEVIAPSTGQAVNPPMVHSLATSVSSPPSTATNNIVAAARGDGCVALYDVMQLGIQEQKKAPAKGKKAAASSTTAKAGSSSDPLQQQEPPRPPGLINILQPQNGGHTAAVNCVAFQAGSGGQNTLSVGNDRRLIVWDWRQSAPLANHQHQAKMNWICTSEEPIGGYDAFVADVNGKLFAWNTCIA